MPPAFLSIMFVSWPLRSLIARLWISGGGIFNRLVFTPFYNVSPLLIALKRRM